MALLGGCWHKEIVGYFPVISLVFKEVVVVSASQNVGLQALV